MLPENHASNQPVVNIPSSGRQLQMVLWDVIDRWHQHEANLTDWESAQQVIEPQQQTDWALLVEQLQLINTFQWHEEDKSHLGQVDDHGLAALKRSIDASNSRRVRTVDTLDELTDDRLKNSGLLAVKSTLQSEAPGSISDRMTVLALKIFHLKEALAEAKQTQAVDDQLNDMHQRLRLLSEQHVDLTGCLDNLLTDIQKGKIGLKLYRQVKLYRDASSGRTQTDLD